MAAVKIDISKPIEGVRGERFELGRTDIPDAIFGRLHLKNGNVVDGIWFYDGTFGSCHGSHRIRNVRPRN